MPCQASFQSHHLMGALHDGTSPSIAPLHIFPPPGNIASQAFLVPKATDRFPLKLLHVPHLVQRDTTVGLLPRFERKLFYLPWGLIIALYLFCVHYGF